VKADKLLTEKVHLRQSMQAPVITIDEPMEALGSAVKQREQLDLGQSETNDVETIYAKATQRKMIR